MAKQTGDIKLTGTFDDLCFYRMEGVYYVRRKSSLTTKRFQKDTAFAGSRKSASRFAEGNRMASVLYQTIPKEGRSYPLFCFLKRKAILLLKEGKTPEETKGILSSYVVNFGLLQEARTKVIGRKEVVVLRAQRRKKRKHCSQYSRYFILPDQGFSFQSSCSRSHFYCLSPPVSDLLFDDL